MYKADLRKTFLEKRLRLTRTEYWELTEKLMEQIRNINWSSYKIIHIFLPISKNKEIDTFSIIEFFKVSYPGISIVIPRTDFEMNSMENVLFDHENTVLFRNKFDIPEPLYGQIIDATKIDLVFMPLIAFDRRGNRVGYGKGFYDRFLGQCRPNVKKVGLSYFSPVELILNTSPWDVKMDVCINPERTWVFNPGDASEPL